jgi:hypothetical protein
VLSKNDIPFFYSIKISRVDIHLFEAKTLFQATTRTIGSVITITTDLIGEKGYSKKELKD